MTNDLNTYGIIFYFIMITMIILMPMILNMDNNNHDNLLYFGD